MPIAQCFIMPMPMLISQLHFAFFMLERFGIAIAHHCALFFDLFLLFHVGQVFTQCLQLKMKQFEKAKGFERITWWMDCSSNVNFARFPGTERKLCSNASTPGSASCSNRSSECSLPLPLVMDSAECCAVKWVLLLLAAAEDWRGEEAVVLKMQKFYENL